MSNTEHASTNVRAQIQAEFHRLAAEAAGRGEMDYSAVSLWALYEQAACNVGPSAVCSIYPLLSDIGLAALVDDSRLVSKEVQ